MTIRNSFVVAAILIVVGAAPPAMAADQRGGGRAQARGDGRAVVRGGGRAVARPIVVAPRRVVRPIVVAPYRPFYRPYYSFRPRISFSLGVWSGYSVPYPSYAYAYPAYRSYAYPYPAYPVYPAYPAYPPSAYPPAYPPGAYPPSYPPATSYPTYPQGSPYPTYPQGSQYPGNQQGSYPGYPQGSVNAAPDAQAIGGISFEFSPANAVIYVDGQYVGPVSNFTPSSAPLSLAPGRHNVQLQAPNYVSLTFDVDIVAGEVIPYRGSLRPY
jgi:hypothetical protein